MGLRFASAALPVSVFSAAIAQHVVSYNDWDVPDVSAYMEIVDEEDLETTEEIPELACLVGAHHWSEPTEIIGDEGDAVLVG